jgi:hypothetical protein
MWPASAHHVPMTRFTYVLAALAATLLTAAIPTAAFAEPAAANAEQCVPVLPERAFYEAGRVGSQELTTPTSRCSTISVSNVRDAANPADRCQVFLVGFWPLVDGSLTYTEPVTACGRHRTVLARNVPDNAHYIVIYAVDYIEPDVQAVKFHIWH